MKRRCWAASGVDAETATTVARARIPPASRTGALLVFITF
jgi:hypothetical protein